MKTGDALSLAIEAISDVQLAMTKDLNSTDIKPAGTEWLGAQDVKIDDTYRLFKDILDSYNDHEAGG